MARIRYRQQTIWDEFERELPPGLKDVAAFLEVLSEFDEELVSDLECHRWRVTEYGQRLAPGRGRNELPVRAMWNLLAVSLYLRHGRQSEVLAELRRNSDLAELLGFEANGPNQYRLPSSSALSRFHRKLRENAKVREVFDRTVSALAQECPDFGKNTALDSSDVRTHARPGKRIQETSGQEGAEGAKKESKKSKKSRKSRKKKKSKKSKKSKDGAKKALTSSNDPEASWSIKSKTRKRSDGTTCKEEKGTFGYRVFFDVDTILPAIVSVEVETGSYPDTKKALAMLDSGLERLPAGRRETVAMDKGFDSTENVAGAWKRGIAAIVPVRDVPPNLDSLLPEDREVPLAPGSNIVRDIYTGEVFCYAGKLGAGVDRTKLTRRKMVYVGAELKRGCHKFRCPPGCAGPQQCPFYNQCAAGSAGSLGRQVRVPFDTDIRRFAPVYPRSKRWKRLYDGRTAVERINGYAKDVLKLDKHALRGKAAIELQAVLAAITINLRTLAAVRAKRQEEAEAA